MVLAMQRGGVKQRTFFPFLIGLNDLVNQSHICKPSALAFADELWVASLICA